MRLLKLIPSWTAAVLTFGLGQAAPKPVEIVVTGNMVREHFGGTGFHAEMFLDTATKEYFDQVLAKRWCELNPSFARIMLKRQRSQDANPNQRLAEQLLFLKRTTATEVYLTGGLKDVPEGEPRRAWAKGIVDDLEYLLKAGATNIKSYCSTNELSLHGWASLRKDLPTFRSYHQALFDEIQKRSLPVKLLATDASPISLWPTIEWAAQNMDGITGVYGGHHYANEYAPDSLEFYDWFKGKCAWGVGIAKAKGKDFILGEFGPGQYMQTRWGIRWDTARFYGTSLEPLGGLQLAEATLGAINAGIYAMGYWTFTDYPDQGGPGGINQWGLFKWMTNGAVTRAPYYAYGLLTKFFRGPARVYQTDTTNALLRIAAVENEQTGAWSIAIINRETRSVPVSITLVKDPGKPFRKYVYDTARVPVTEDGDLQEPSGKLAARKGRLADTVQPQSLTVYTTAYDDEAPAAVRGLQISDVRQAKVSAASDASVLRWQANTEKDICYYRVYHDEIRLGSTITTEFIDAGPTRRGRGDYTVIAVDQSGNAGPPQRIAQVTK